MVQGSPINDIMQMKQQGLSNNQIIQNLQRQGYSNTQIFDAMNQADTKLAVEGAQPGFIQQPSQEFQSEFADSQMPADQDFYPKQHDQTPKETQVKIEELIEAIIEEKWEELVKDVNKIIEWKNKTESKMIELETQIQNLKAGFSDLNKAVLGKINDYDKHILEVGSEIKAMEKVFTKILPSFTENVHELSRIAERFKSQKLKSGEIK